MSEIADKNLMPTLCLSLLDIAADCFGASVFSFKSCAPSEKYLSPKQVPFSTSHIAILFTSALVHGGTCSPLFTMSLNYTDQKCIRQLAFPFKDHFDNLYPSKTNTKLHLPSCLGAWKLPT